MKTSITEFDIFSDQVSGAFDEMMNFVGRKLPEYSKDCISAALGESFMKMTENYGDRSHKKMLINNLIEKWL